MLHLHHNKLKKLPDSIGNLECLQTLNISHNGLKELPDTLKNLVRLKSLDVSNNPKLKKLPKTLAHCHAVETLVVTWATNGTKGDGIQYPPPDVCQKGAAAIMQFLCKGRASPCSTLYNFV